MVVVSVWSSSARRRLPRSLGFFSLLWRAWSLGGVDLVLAGLRNRMRRSLAGVERLAVVVRAGVSSMARVVARGRPSMSGGWSRNSMGGCARMRWRLARWWR